jgi:uncharacterized repeat protein (TIGR03843 family)
LPKDKRAPSAPILKLLSQGEVTVEGRMPWSSNGTYLATVSAGGDGLLAVYKPGRAERPLWDFPSGLYKREVAAFELSAALGWGFVPETVTRPDGPLGPGSLQRFVEADFEQHYFTLLEDERHHPGLRRIATFDVLANNADRKAGHCLLDLEGKLWGIDHGLCFHQQAKLRTVIWDFAGEPLGEGDLEDLRRLQSGGLPASLSQLLEPAELVALTRRLEGLLRRGTLPSPGPSSRPYPWPLV